VLLAQLLVVLLGTCDPGQVVAMLADQVHELGMAIVALLAEI